MLLLNKLDCGGTLYGVAPILPIGSSDTPAGTAIKECLFSDSFELEIGAIVAIQFTYANTYGDGVTTFPSLRINGSDYALKTLKGAYTASGAWDNGETILVMFNGTAFLML
jgi:hypothetical protein